MKQQKRVYEIPTHIWAQQEISEKFSNAVDKIRE